ncbi:MAG: phosphoribosylanthranilate isomerase [Cytophagales bacterium]|nr:phosphoribosylanthranilate isomerase [Cytophagales bacterium]
MASKILIKISEVNNLSDARYCAGMGATLMGFPVDKAHPHYISPNKFKEITAWISGVKFVGELATNNLQIIENILKNYTLDYIQLNDQGVLDTVLPLNVPVILRLVLRGAESVEALHEFMDKYSPHISYFLIETTQVNEQVVTQLQQNIIQLATYFPIIQAFNLFSDNLPLLLEKTKIRGIALQGGEEIKPGYKDFSGLADILEVLEMD